MGLLGIVAHRTKEIGIRKVLGASTNKHRRPHRSRSHQANRYRIRYCCPLSWMLLNRWLEGFAYRVDLKPQIFVICGSCTLLFALLVVGIRTVRAATVSPIESLRVNE